ncbi:MAG: hypothetical protein WC516_04905 [Patescibacteria group bacterium]
MCELIIKIPEDSPNANLTIVDPNGLIRKKSVDIEDLVATLVSDYKLATGLMPLGTRFYKGSNVNFSMAVEVPAKIRDLTLSKYNSAGTKRINEVIQVPYPTCLFYFSIKDGKIYDLRINALKYPLQSENDGLFCFPFSNVYNDGRVCWGGVSLPKISKPMDLVSVINLFLGSQFNGDLAGSNFVAPKGVDIFDFWTLISHVKTLQEFPIEMLRSNGLTFKQIVKEKE